MFTRAKYGRIKYFSLFLIELINTYNYSLRDIDKLYHYLDLLLPTDPEFNNTPTEYKDLYIISVSYLYAVLIILK